MSTKIPVGEIIGQSFRFAFSRYLTLLGIIWLPMIAMAAIVVFVLVPFIHTMIAFFNYQSQHPGNADFDAAPFPNFGLIMLAELLMLYIYAWIGAGATKEILGLRTGSKLFYLPGKDEFNICVTYIATFLLCYFGIIAVMIVVAIVCGLAAAVVAGLGSVDPSKLTALEGPVIALFGVVELGFFYLLIRATWLIQPLTIVAKKIDVFGSWRLMKGNVLRAFVIMLVMTLPIIVLEMVVYAAAAVSVFTSLPPHPETMKPDEVFAFVFMMMERILPAAGIAGILIMPLFLGLSRAPSAYAYRLLAPPKPAAPPAAA